MMRLSLLATVVALAASSVAAQVKPPGERPVALVSHRAIYDLQLADGGGSKAPASASGRIAFDFSAACDGYVQNLRQIVDMEPNEGERRITETRSSTFEDASGADFRFRTTRTDDESADVDGRARRDARGVSIALSRPKPFRLSTERDVLFPTQHIERIIEAARRGEKVLLARVYDGSDDGRRIFNVTTIIGKEQRGADGDQGAQDPIFSNLSRWRVAIAYFPEERRDGLPDYVLSFDLYENGVSAKLKLDYGDFVLTGELTRIEFPPAAKCSR